MIVTNDFQSGWAFTKDSFCYSDNHKNLIIKYSNIKYVHQESGLLTLYFKDNNDPMYFSNTNHNFDFLFGFDGNFIGKVVDYLNIVKDF